jgi:hypothetical protein
VKISASGEAEELKNLWIREAKKGIRKVKTRTLESEGCGTRGCSTGKALAGILRIQKQFTK